MSNGKALGYIPFADYLAIDAVNSSFLRDARKSFAHAMFHKTHPGRSDAMSLGDATHAAILEPARYAKEFMVAPQCDKRTTAGKAMWKQFCEEFPDARIISADDRERINGMQAAIMASKEARKWLYEFPGVNENSWTWERDGVLCKMRADRVITMTEWSAVVDLKTARECTEKAIRYSVLDYGYHLAAAWYHDGLSQYQSNVSRAVLVFVESEPPHGVAVYELDAVWLDAAVVEIDRLWGEYLACKKAGAWTGYPDELQQLMAPDWMAELEA